MPDAVGSDARRLVMLLIAMCLVVTGCVSGEPTATTAGSGPTPDSSDIEPTTATSLSADLPPFDLESFAGSKLHGEFGEMSDRVGIVVLSPEDLGLEVEHRVAELSVEDMGGFTYVPSAQVTGAAARFSTSRGSERLVGNWVAFGLIPEFNDSPVDEWVASLREIPGTIVVRVVFETVNVRIPEDWTVVADLSFGVASGAEVEALGLGIVVVQPGSTALIGFDGAVTVGEPPPLPMAEACCGTEEGLPAGDWLVLVEEGLTHTWILDIETMTWRQAEPRPSRDYVLGSALIGDELFVVTAAPRSGEATSSLAALNLIGGTWRELERVPRPISVGGVTTDGIRLIVAGTQQGRFNDVIGSRLPVVYEYTPGAGWSQLPDIPFDGQASTVAWLEEAGLLAWNYDLKSALLDSSGAWRRLDNVPMRPAECYPHSYPTVGGAAGLCGGIAWFDAESADWTPMPIPFETRGFVVTDDAIFGLVSGPRDHTKLIQLLLPPPLPVEPADP